MSKKDNNIENEIIEEVKDLEDELDDLDELDEPKDVTVMDMLNRIVVCLIVIAIILAINTTVLIFKNNSSSSSKETTTNSTPKTDESSSNYDVSKMKEVSLSDALALFDDKDKTYVLYIGRPDCSACITYVPTLNEAQENLGYTTQYLNLNNIDTKSDDFTKFSNKLSVKYTMNIEGTDRTETFGTWIGYTPMTIIIKNGKMVDGEIGAINYSTLVSLLKNNGIE